MDLLRYKKSTNSPPTEIPKPTSKRYKPWLIGIAIVTLSGGIGYWFISVPPTTTTSDTTPTVTIAPVAVTALGRLEPEGEVIKLSVANAQDSRVNELLVEEGDRVAAGQLIATLQGLEQKQAELSQAKKNLAIYQAKMAQIQAGEAKIAEINAQKANIARLQAQLRTETMERQAEIADAQAELAHAKTNYQRYRSLYQQGAASQSALDDRREILTKTEAQLQQMQARLDNTISTLTEQIRQEQAILAQLQEVRPVDIEEAQAEIDYAVAQVERIEAELEDYYVRVPIEGQILKINTHVGEQVNTSEGIVELGRTEQMYAIAEVYETDIGKVKVGQPASIVSEHGGFEGELQGTVDHIGLQIKKQNVLESDPAADKDARVVEVKVKLDPEASNKVAGLTNLQVRVRINLGSS